MRFAYFVVLIIFQCFTSPSVRAADAPFSGTWMIDLRTEVEKQHQSECGYAMFKLIQDGEKITGQHAFETTNCSRSNEGGAVIGLAQGSVAVLVVTSGRNGAIVMGKATLKKKGLYWETTDEIKQGDPQGDSPLILGKGLLKREVGQTRH